jgi:hypothetical protein
MTALKRRDKLLVDAQRHVRAYCQGIGRAGKERQRTSQEENNRYHAFHDTILRNPDEMSRIAEHG